MPEAQHFSILVADLEGSGTLRDAEKPLVRRDLYGLLRAGLHLNDVDWDICRTEDRGDGVYVLIPGAVPKCRLGSGLVAELDRLLGERRVGDARMRVRLALHCGEVTFDEHGSSGADVDTTFAMVDHQRVRDVLAAAPNSRMVVVTSDPIFRAAFCGGDPTWMRRQELRTKRDMLRAWIGVPGLRHPPVLDETPEESAPEPAPAPSAPGQTYLAPKIGDDSVVTISGGDIVSPMIGRTIRIDGGYTPSGNRNGGRS
jgi:class 3 adenylate cyclase